MAFQRRTPSRRLLAVVNLSNRAVEAHVTAAGAGWQPLVQDGVTVDQEAAGTTFKLTSFGYFVGKQNQP